MTAIDFPTNENENAVLVRGAAPDYMKLDADAFPAPAADEAGAILEITDTGDRYRWSSTNWIKIVTKGAVDIYSPEFLLQVAAGTVAKHSLLQFQVKGTVGTVFEDIWGSTGNMVYPTAAESWEIVSDDANDNIAGTGGRVVAVVSLDANNVRQTQLVALNGTTPVAIPGTHIRPQSAVVATAGSSEFNEGTITVQVAGGGAVRNIVLPTDGISFDGHLSIPANTTAYSLQIFVLFPKNQSGNAFVHLRNDALPDASWITSSPIPLYQNIVSIATRSPFRLDAQFDIRARAKVDVGSAEVTLIAEFLFIED